MFFKGVIQVHPSQHLLVLTQQLKHLNNVCNLFKVNYKDTRKMSSSGVSGVFFVDALQVFS